MKVLVFAGTTEGRLFACRCAEVGFDTTASVATEYGRILAEEKLRSENQKFQNKESFSNLKIIENRLGESQMENLFSDFDFIVDATHPFALEVTANIKKACEASNKKYFRLLRPSSDFLKESVKNFGSSFFEFDSLEELCGGICEFDEKCASESKNLPNIFISTGSKELSCFKKIANFAERCFVRVLPSIDSVQKCIEGGFLSKNVIAMQGPFSVALNEAMFRETKSGILVTKESGRAGGFDEKIEAAKNCGMHVFSVKRPKENAEGTFSDIEELIRKICEENEK